MWQDRASTRFPRSARLTRPDEFKRVFDNPVKSSDACFTLLARDNGLGHARLGLAISKKHAKQAVARNRLKRIVRASFRMNQAQVAGLDVVVLARQGAAAKTSHELHASLTKQWHRLVQRCRKSSSS